MKLVLFLFMVFLASSAGMTYAELQENLVETISSPFVSLMFVYDSASESIAYPILEGPLMERAITEIGQRKEGYFKTIPIDCNTDDKDVAKNFPYCGKDIRPKLPALMYTEPALNPINPETG